MKRAKYTVSALVPCYNKAEHIGQVVDALIEQTCPPDEIIVIDDASNDETRKLVRKLPVRFLRHTINRGPAVARNTGLEAASGEIVLFVDADAYADPHLIEELSQVYQHSPEPRLAGVGGRGIESDIRTHFDRWRAHHAKQDFGPRSRRNAPYLFGLCASYKRGALLEVGGFDSFFRTNAGEDADIGYRLRRSGYRLHYTPSAVVYHHHSDTAETLKQVQFNWFYWTFLAKQRSKFHPWTLIAGTLRRVFTDTLTDLIVRRDIELSRLDLEIFLVKMTALIHALRFGKR
ncbi:MAG: glycosyltransferase family 2 protein [Anaerolineales bacterium]